VRVSKRAKLSTAQNHGCSKLRCEDKKRKPTLKALAIRAVSASLLAGLACLQAACGSTPSQTFDLAGDSPSIRSFAKGMRGRARLVIGEPEAIPPANSNRIVIRTGPTEVANLSGAQWADRLTRLVQTQLLKGFENAGVQATTPGKSADFSFATEIRRFEIDVTRGLAVVEISARIIDDRSNTQRAARVFIAETPAPRTSGSEAPLALKAALETTIGQMTHWAAGVI
jgi:cholesterol transport system auxiliary component